MRWKLLIKTAKKIFFKNPSTDRTSAKLKRQSTEINTSTNKFSGAQTVASLAKYKPSEEV